MKKEYKYFSIFNYEAEQEYLREQHKKGWKFVKVTGLGMYHFTECEPEDVIYQLDYNKEGIGHKEEYVKMFSDCGWEYIQDYAGYSYFRKPVAEMENDESIFCDESSRLAMMERVYKGRLLPLLAILICALLPCFIIYLSKGNYLIAAFMGCVILLYIAVIGYSRYHYYRNKN